MGKPEQLLISFRLFEEVRSSGLQVEYDVDPVFGGVVDPGSQRVDGRLIGVVAVQARRGRRHRCDQLEHRHHGCPVGPVVVHDGSHPDIGGFGALLAQDAEVVGERAAVEADQALAGKQGRATAGQLGVGPNQLDLPCGARLEATNQPEGRCLFDDEPHRIGEI